MMVRVDVHVSIHGTGSSAKNVPQNHAMVMVYGITSNVHVYAMHHGCQIRNVKHVDIWNVVNMVHLLKKIAIVNAKVIGKVFSATNAQRKRSVSLLALIAVYMHGMRKNVNVKNNANRWIVNTMVSKIQKHVIVNVTHKAMVRMQVNLAIPSY
tara:strand:+ start:116 stop:574 length:459 start_codon:yes stop_codon:yes gene_type:complete